MKKVYQITKFVLAKNAKEEYEVEKEYPAEEVMLTKHSTDILLDSIHKKNI